MKFKTKIILKYPILGWRNHRARVMAKKSGKEINSEKYPLRWKNDYVIKKAVKFTKEFGVELVVHGYENVPKQPSIITPNHHSALDPMALLAALKNPEPGSDALNPLVMFIGKEELKKNKRVKGYMDLIGTVYIPRKNPRKALQKLDEAIVEAKENTRHIILFPEGTRTKDGNLQDFKSGAFRIAKKAYLSIVPVTINNTIEVADFKRKEKIKVEVFFHKPLKPISFMALNNYAIAQRVKKIVESKYKKPKIIKNSDKTLAR